MVCINLSKVEDEVTIQFDNEYESETPWISIHPGVSLYNTETKVRSIWANVFGVYALTQEESDMVAIVHIDTHFEAIATDHDVQIEDKQHELDTIEGVSNEIQVLKVMDMVNNSTKEVKDLITGLYIKCGYKR